MLQAVKLKGHFNIYSHISINAGYLFLVTPTPYFGHPANTVAVRTCRCHDGFPAALSSSFLLQATPTSRSGPLRLTNSSSLTLTSKSLLLITHSVAHHARNAQNPESVQRQSGYAPASHRAIRVCQSLYGLYPAVHK